MIIYWFSRYLLLDLMDLLNKSIRVLEKIRFSMKFIFKSWLVVIIWLYQLYFFLDCTHPNSWLTLAKWFIFWVLKEEKLRLEMKYPAVIEERGASEKRGLRQKRFHQMHLNIGCVKGFKCCEDVKCKPYCSMCSYGKLKSNCLDSEK